MEPLVELGEDMLKPKLRIIYNTRKNRFEKIRDVDLRKSTNDRIVKTVAPSDFDINLSDFL